MIEDRRKHTMQLPLIVATRLLYQVLSVFAYHELSRHCRSTYLIESGGLASMTARLERLHNFLGG